MRSRHLRRCARKIIKAMAFLSLLGKQYYLEELGCEP